MTELSGFEEKIMEYFSRYDEAYEGCAARAGLTFTTLSVLDCVCALGEGCTQKQVAEKLRFSKQQVNQALSLFLAKEYVVLRENPKDRRNKGIYFTDKGKDFAEKSVLSVWKAGKRAADTLSLREQEQFLSVLDRYVAAFERETAAFPGKE